MRDFTESIVMEQDNKVRPIEPISKDIFQRRLAAAWGRVWPTVGKGAMAQAMGLNHTKAIDRGVTGINLPEAHTIFNSLLADKTALDEVIAWYGCKITPVGITAANDFATAAGTLDAMSALVRALADQRRDHKETLDIAALLRPHIAALNAIVREADEHRGAA